MLNGVFCADVCIYIHSAVKSLCFEAFSFLSCLFVSKVMLCLNCAAYRTCAQRMGAKRPVESINFPNKTPEVTEIVKIRSPLVL